MLLLKTQGRCSMSLQTTLVFVLCGLKNVLRLLDDSMVRRSEMIAGLAVGGGCSRRLLIAGCKNHDMALKPVATCHVISEARNLLEPLPVSLNLCSCCFVGPMQFGSGFCCYLGPSSPPIQCDFAPYCCADRTFSPDSGNFVFSTTSR